MDSASRTVWVWRKSLRYSAWAVGSPRRERVSVVMVFERPIPRWSRRRICKGEGNGISIKLQGYSVCI